MEKIYLFLFVSLFLSCSSHSVKREEVKVIDSIIRIGDAIANPLSMSLSSFVDSITYVPLETTKSYVRNKELISYVKPYWIVFPGDVFDEKGRFISHIGALGQGRGEETNGWGYSIFYDNHRMFFYTIGDKIIQFDTNGKFTGKETRISYREGNAMQVARGLKNVVALLKANTKYVVINYPDSIFWMNSDLEIIQGIRIIPDSLFLDPPGDANGMSYTFSEYKDTTLFYNCFTDAVYVVAYVGLQKRWDLDLKGLKPDNRCFLNDYNRLYLREMSKIVRSSNGNENVIRSKAENCELARLIDDKKWISRVYESERYVLISWVNLKAFPGWREIKEGPHLAFYDKLSGKTVAVAGNGLIDDIDGGMIFYPSLGVSGNTMVYSVWPYELKDYVQRKKEEGGTVSERLVTFVNSLDDEQNPILVIAHLKK